MPDLKLEELCINTIRFLSVDAVQKAKSGHPGAPMGAATMMFTLWNRYLRHNPSDPMWMDRDRFVLSAGHASAMLYSMLHLTGYDLDMSDIKAFRQLNSKTPGHPEYGLTPGVESTTGPLGQGFANGVGMAIAERWLSQHFNKPDFELINHYTYSILSDGDLQEGVASEAASLAGALGLGKLVYLYDDNHITIEGETDITFTENVRKRFEAYGWHVIGPIDGMDVESVDIALKEARVRLDMPSLIICSTVIGYGSPGKQGTSSSHGEPLGETEVNLMRETLGWEYSEPFIIPQQALNHFRIALNRGKEQQSQWETLFERYRVIYPKAAEELISSVSGDLPDGWDDNLSELFQTEKRSIATREASGQIMNLISDKIHHFIGGSADLGPSNKTILNDRSHYSIENHGGHNFHFGVREHAMGAVTNGMALHGGIMPYAATFLIFSDYMRPPMRLAALMKLGVIYVFTHDSIGLGEDGPTHQPVEQLLSLRAIPNMVVVRPADAIETIGAWKIAIQRKNGPTALALSRQNLPILDREAGVSIDDVGKGGYVLLRGSDEPDVILIGTGSEVQIAVEAKDILSREGIIGRVVSMPSWELFDEQTDAYRNSVLPPDVSARVSIEAGTTMGWVRYVGGKGISVGVPHFGSSAPYAQLYETFGLTTDRVVEEARTLVSGG